VKNFSFAEESVKPAKSGKNSLAEFADETPWSQPKEFWTYMYKFAENDCYKLMKPSRLTFWYFFKKISVLSSLFCHFSSNVWKFYF
jgi:hypothetical protein